MLFQFEKINAAKPATRSNFELSILFVMLRVNTKHCVQQ